MTITLKMPPPLEARVREEAAREGIDPGTLVLRAVEKQLAPHADTTKEMSEPELLRLINAGPAGTV